MFLFARATTWTWLMRILRVWQNQTWAQNRQIRTMRWHDVLNLSYDKCLQRCTRARSMMPFTRIHTWPANALQSVDNHFLRGVALWFLLHRVTYMRRYILGNHEGEEQKNVERSIKADELLVVLAFVGLCKTANKPLSYDLWRFITVWTCEQYLVVIQMTIKVQGLNACTIVIILFFYYYKCTIEANVTPVDSLFTVEFHCKIVSDIQCC